MTLKKLCISLILILSVCGACPAQTLQWRNLPNSPYYPNNRLEDVYFINANTGWTVHYSGKVFRTTNGGAEWDTLFISSVGSLRSIGFFDELNGLLGTLSDDSNLVLFKTSDGGKNFSVITNLPDPRIKGTCGINILNDNIAYACGRWDTPARIIKTTDKGNTWSSFIVDTLIAKSLVDCYFWSADSGLAVGGSNPLYNGNAVVIKTVNGGNTWQQVYRSARAGEYCWKICNLNSNNFYVSIQGPSMYYLRSTNRGISWEEQQFRTYTQQGIGFLNENTGWIGGWTGPNHETTDAGVSWHLAGWGRNVNRFRFLNDTLAYAVGDRVYKYSRGTVGIQNVSNEIPESYKLYQNYPNPFNPETVIRYSLIENSFITLKVYDVLGNEVATLVKENQNRGSYNYQLSTVNYQLSSGVYFYTLNAGDFKETKRMILLK